MLTLLLVLTAQSLPSDNDEAALRARCSQLIAYFDRWGVTRSAHTDGRRNHTRLGAEIDCNNRLYAKGIAEMETLLRNKKFTVPLVAPDEIDMDE
ncbi:hypothetical protein BH10PSE6_BH10PSE6_34970 [soil metagenome]